jgi:hypothetical protein
MTSPLRRLHGISYWVLDSPEDIREFINTNLKREWENDAKSESRDSKSDPWLQSLPQTRWHLAIVNVETVKQNPNVVNYVNPDSGYDFSKSLVKRVENLRRAIEQADAVIWPLVVRNEGMRLVDGYCRLATLREMKILQAYAYLGTPARTSRKPAQY